jgi:hypothetical protein
MQWTTVRLVVSENDRRCYQSEIKLTGGEEAYLHFGRGDETRVLSLKENRTRKQWG